MHAPPRRPSGPDPPERRSARTPAARAPRPRAWAAPFDGPEPATPLDPPESDTPLDAPGSGTALDASETARPLDALVFSPLFVAATAAALTAAAARSLGVPTPALAMALAFCGTVVVYTIDRLRDLPRDRLTAPARSAFVARHHRALTLGAAGCGAVALPLALHAGPTALAVVGAVGAFGLLHRRLKRVLWAKPLYLTAAWTAVTVGLPAAAPGRAHHLAAVTAVVALCVLANVVLSNLRDGEGAAGRLGRRRALGLAGTLLLPPAALAAFGPPALRPLLALPVCMALAVVGFRPGERYGLWVVDGALLAGALLALAAGAALGLPAAV